MGSSQRGTLDAYVETSPGHCQRRRAGPRSIPAGWAPHRDHQLWRCPTQLPDKPTSGPHKVGGQSPPDPPVGQAVETGLRSALSLRPGRRAGPGSGSALTTT